MNITRREKERECVVIISRLVAKLRIVSMRVFMRWKSLLLTELSALYFEIHKRDKSIFIHLVNISLIR